MDGADVAARLYKLKDNLDGPSEGDKAFVNDMVRLHESGQLLNRHHILRIIEMRVPGEVVPEESRVWTQGTVNVVNASLEEVIWRYLPLEQLFALLWKKALHFSPLAVMGDTSEGHLTERAFQEAKKQLPQNVGGMDADTITAIMMAQRKTDACINCWYMDGPDSLKMWQEYAPKNGVAIQSTVGRLGSCLRECSTPITIGQVTYFAREEEERYIDEMFYGSLFVKHDPFRHEKELRALAFQVNIGCGVDIPVDREILIERLVLSPELRDWAVPVITEAIRRFDFDGLVEKSTLKMPNGVA